MKKKEKEINIQDSDKENITNAQEHFFYQIFNNFVTFYLSTP